MKHGSLFSGIGGFDLAAEWMGWENIFHCEWNKFGQKILKYYWPKSISYENICTTDFTSHRGQIDILTGGFPCQPYSTAGKRLGKEDERHLWPEMLRAIREIKPRWIMGENVRGLISWNGGMVFEEVQADLEAEGYEVQSFLIPAASVNAPHRRDRIWFIAYSNYKGRCSRSGQVQGEDGEISEWDKNAKSCDSNQINAFVNGDGDVADSECERLYGENKTWEENNLNRESAKIWGSATRYNMEININATNGISKWKDFPTVSPICNGDDGLSNKLDSITFPKWRNESIKGGGNAIVPQVVLQIFKAIEQYENINK